MPLSHQMHFGLQPGLRFALVIKPDGSTLDLDWEGIRHWRREDGFLWVHLERDDPAAQAWISQDCGIDHLVAEALLAEESRPRVQDIEDSLLLVLRGVNISHANSEEDAFTSTELVPVHIWMESGRCISLRDKAHNLTALRDLRISMAHGKGPRDASSLLARIAEKVTDHLGDLVDELEEEVLALENRMIDYADTATLSKDIAITRRRVVQFRRYLAPQRDALFRLRHDDASWLTADAKNHLREVSDRLARHLEDLDEIRSRTTILQEERATMVSEEGNRNTFALSVVSVVMLPMSFITGFFGMNTGALPFGTEHPYGTWLATGVIILVGIITILGVRFGLFRRPRR